MQDHLSKYLFRYLAGAVAAVLAAGTVFYHFQEHWSWLDAYYFCVVTLATVGYGDLVPHTPLGKLITTFYIMAGVGILTSFFAVLVRRRADKRINHRHPADSTKNPGPKL